VSQNLAKDDEEKLRKKTDKKVVARYLNALAYLYLSFLTLWLNAWHYLYKINSMAAQQDNTEFRMKNMKRTSGITDNFLGWQPLLAYVSSCKQKCMTKSSTEAELVGVTANVS
jgi:hypothetical protein